MNYHVYREYLSLKKVTEKNYQEFFGCLCCLWLVI